VGPAAAVDLAGTMLVAGRPAAGVVVTVEGPRLPAPSESSTHVMDHREIDLVPHVLVTRLGDRVRFENSDGMPCRIYSITPGALFVVRPQAGQSRTVRFERPGVVEVRCSEHGRLLAYVLVRENPYYAITDAGGRYRIPGVPAGRWAVQAWHEGGVLARRAIDAAGVTLTLDLQSPHPSPNPRGGDVPVSPFHASGGQNEAP
jgi:plastocyanin